MPELFSKGGSRSVAGGLLLVGVGMVLGWVAAADLGFRPVVSLA